MDSLVTVVMPVAQAHIPLLPRALHSLSQQTYLPQVLVVNDTNQPLPVPCIETGGQHGSAYCRNLGLDHVKTPFTFFLDADDYLLDTALETFLRNAETATTCYLYSDWLQYNDRGYTTHKAKNYNRQRMLRHSIHLVSIFIETDAAKSVYYDINYRGWEDWEFHIRLGEKGFCGTRIPEPLLIYDMTTSLNRVAHNAMQDEVYAEIQTKYQAYLNEEQEFMPCNTCGGNRAKIKPPVQAMPPEPVEGMVMLEYMGENTAPVTFKVGRNVYRGANDEANKLVNVWAQDVPELMERGPFRRVSKASKPAAIPQPEEFNQWRQTNQPVEPPSDWKKLFAQNAVMIPEQPSAELPVAEPKKRTRRTKAQIAAEHYEQTAAD